VIRLVAMVLPLPEAAMVLVPVPVPALELVEEPGLVYY
jgi:hypothetical protein